MTDASLGNNAILKKQIAQALNALIGNGLREQTKELLNVLGYTSDRTVDSSRDSKKFAADYPAPNANTKTEARFLKNVKAVHIVFQVTDDEIYSSAQIGLLAGDDFDEGLAKSFLFIAVNLKQVEYARGKYAEMTREINKRFRMPVCVLFRNGKRITLAFADRRESRAPGNANREVLGKVSLIRDINAETPHRAHLDILAELSLNERLHWMKENRKQENFDGLLKSWLAILNTEELNKRFYDELHAWFDWAMGKVRFPCPEQKFVSKQDHVIRLITRILFIWFVKEKELVTGELFVEAQIAPLLKNYSRENDDYYRAVLQNLFFATLNTECDNRSFSKAREDTHRNFSLYRYKDLLAKPQELLQLMAKTPFINGGLFDCLDSEDSTSEGGYRLDCFSDNTKHRKQLSVPNYLFFNDRVGLFPLLNKYKFTVEENTPIEQEVALDPELLGKVFENLLAANNPETSSMTARRQTGSYYTPRVIVDYMVDEAVVASLAETVEPAVGGQNSWRNRLRDLLDYSTPDCLMEKSEIAPLVAAISGMKILDPAAGSGAFPMGVLHKLTLALGKLDPKNELWLELQKQRAVAETKDVYNKQKDLNTRNALLKDISGTFARYSSNFGRKLYLIQNSIFGVDIQPIACQIAKLRFFISLAIEQQRNNKEKNYGIKPLPNLETRFVAADTLMGLQLANGSLLESPQITELENQLRENRERHFNADTRKQKLLCGKKDRELRRKLAGVLETYYQRSAAWEEARRIISEELLVLKNQKARYQDKISKSKQSNLLQDSENNRASGGEHLHYDKKIQELNKKIVEYETFGAAVTHEDKSLKSSGIWKKAEKAAAIKNGRIHAESQKISKWDPYDQNARADWFDPEWMFGIREGFDIVIGNPPYKQVPKGIYPARRFPYSEGKDRGKQNLYKLFVEQSYNLCKERGLGALIVQSSLMCDLSSTATRQLLLNCTQLRRIIEFPEKAQSRDAQVFSNVAQGTCICLFSKIPSANVQIQISVGNDAHSILQLKFSPISKKIILDLFPDLMYFPRIKKGSVSILEKISDDKTISSLKHYTVTIAQGDLNLTSHSAKFSSHPSSVLLLRGRHVDRFLVKYKESTEYCEEGFMRRKVDANRHDIFLISQEVMSTLATRRLNVALTTNPLRNFLWGHSVNKILLKNQADSEVFLALLNSKFMDWYFRITSSNNHIQGYELEQLPIPQMSVTERKQLHNLAASITKAKASDPNTDTRDQEAEIDQLVYKLYNLTEKEIAFIEHK